MDNNIKGRNEWLNADALLALDKHKGTGQSYSGVIIDLVKSHAYLHKKNGELEKELEYYKGVQNV